ncbi:MAG: hypothetical protein WCV85_02600 [Patescibacteria group bacterium]|jgi:hypothetical protein
MQALNTFSNALNVAGIIRRRRAFKALAQMNRDFMVLRNNLRYASGYAGCPLDRLVLLFKAVSPFYDRLPEFRALLVRFQAGNYDGSLGRQVEAISTLIAHFGNCGRDPYGMNRTKPGDGVTEYKVYLGNIYGLFPQPVPTWKECKNWLKGGWGSPKMAHLNAYDVVCGQANSFANPHFKPMIEALEVLGA